MPDPTPLSCLPNLERNNGEVVINNTSVTAILNAQKAFKGAAKDFGVNSDEDAQRLVDEVRYKNPV